MNKINLKKIPLWKNKNWSQSDREEIYKEIEKREKKIAELEDEVKKRRELRRLELMEDAKALKFWQKRYEGLFNENEKIEKQLKLALAEAKQYYKSMNIYEDRLLAIREEVKKLKGDCTGSCGVVVDIYIDKVLEIIKKKVKQ